ncbi:hypothetical protein POTOM_039456 [Populus tomentosa]|uniref:Uncharacterized protein n=1 Tax=Populus tomentosa TaxID=118781 RepID=A0A8X8CJI9_POPTO|nr:hypothetical protein POTOM_039456 [Populus tomentosa]
MLFSFADMESFPCYSFQSLAEVALIGKEFQCIPFTTFTVCNAESGPANRSNFKQWTFSTIENHEGADSKLIQGDSFRT